MTTSTATVREVSEPRQTSYAIQLVLQRPGLAAEHLQHAASQFATSLTAQRADVSYWVADRDSRPVAGAVAIDAPGRTSMLFVTSCEALPAADRSVVAEMLRHLSAVKDAAGVRLVQGLIEPSDRRDQQAYDAAGFHRLATLVYMERGVGPMREAPTDESGLSWLNYSSQTHALFCHTISQTYQGSVDCPGLEGVRTIDEVVLGHKATGTFDPGGWLLLLRDGRPQGCLLMAGVIGRSACEVVYMGLVPEARGRRLGRVVLHRALAEARRARRDQLVLAVDENNLPARRLYDAFGFRRTMKRQAWVRVLHPANST